MQIKKNMKKQLRSITILLNNRQKEIFKMSIAIEFKNVYKQFKGAAYSAVDNVSLKIEHGEFITIQDLQGVERQHSLR